MSKEEEENKRLEGQRRRGPRRTVEEEKHTPKKYVRFSIRLNLLHVIKPASSRSISFPYSEQAGLHTIECTMGPGLACLLPSILCCVIHLKQVTSYYLANVTIGACRALPSITTRPDSISQVLEGSMQQYFHKLDTRRNVGDQIQIAQCYIHRIVSTKKAQRPKPKTDGRLLFHK